MPRFLLTWLATAVSLLVTAYFVPGIHLESWTVALVGAVVLGLINALVRPLLVLFTLPLTILTLGLFLLVVNALSFSLVAYFTPGFTIDSFWDALFGSIVLAIVFSVLNHVLGTQD